MQQGGRKFQKTEKTKFRKDRELWGDGPQKPTNHKKRHHDRTTYRLLKIENREYET